MLEIGKASPCTAVRCEKHCVQKMAGNMVCVTEMPAAHLQPTPLEELVTLA